MCTEEEVKAFNQMLRDSEQLRREYAAHAYLNALLRCHARQLFPKNAAAATGKPVFRAAMRWAPIAAILALLATGGAVLLRRIARPATPESFVQAKDFHASTAEKELEPPFSAAPSSAKAEEPSIPFPSEIAPTLSDKEQPENVPADIPPRENPQDKETTMNASQIAQTATSAILVAAASFSYAGTPYYWDNNGAEAGFGAAGGTWGADALWSMDETGVVAPSQIETGTTNDLFFGTLTNGLASGVISLSGTNSFASLTFGAASGAITLTNGALNLTGIQAILQGNATNRIDSMLTGTGGVQFAQNTTLVYNKYLSESWQTIFTNTFLNSIGTLTCTFGGGNITVGATGMPYYFVNDGTNATVQFQRFEGDWTKAIKVAFRQVADTVEAKILYAKYYNQNSVNKVGIDFDDSSNPLILGYGIATSETAGGYGVQSISRYAPKTLELTGASDFAGPLNTENLIIRLSGGSSLGNGNYAGAITNNGRIVYAGYTKQTLSGSITGNGSLFVSSGETTPQTLTRTDFLPTAWTIVQPDAYLAEYTGVVAAVMGGGSVNASGSYPPAKYMLNTTPCSFTNDGATATCQLQAVDGQWLKCVILSLTQDGSNIVARMVDSRYISSSNHSIGFDFVNGTGWSTYSIATSLSANGYGIASFTLAGTQTGQLTLTNTVSCSGGVTVSGGRLIATSAYSLPSSGGILVTARGRLVLNNGEFLGAENTGGVGHGNPITATDGGIVELVGSFCAGQTRLFTIDGGTLLVSRHRYWDSYTDAENYVNNLTLKNGGRVRGYPLMLVYHAPAVFTVSGTRPSSLEGGYSLVSGNTFTINVEDVTGDTNADFFVSGKICDYPGYGGAPTFKTGAGTMSLATTNSTSGAISIVSGAVRLDSSKALTPNNTVVLAGGTLELGSSTNAAGALVLGANSSISLGKGQISFTDSSAFAWTNNCQLTLSGSLLPHSVRFGTNKVALTASQLSAIRYNKGSVILTNEGYLKESPRGTVVMLM